MKLINSGTIPLSKGSIVLYIIILLLLCPPVALGTTAIIIYLVLVNSDQQEQKQIQLTIITVFMLAIAALWHIA